MVIDPQGNVWIDVFPQLGLLHYDGEQWTILLPDHDVTAVTFDAQGRAWIGTDGDGILVRYPDKWINYQIDGFGCSDNEITALGVDPQGRVWVATDDGAVVFAEGSVIACYPLDSHIWEFAFDNEGGIYVTTVLDGLYYLNQGEWERLVSDTWMHPGSLAVDANGLVWTTGRELRVFDGRDLVMSFADIAGGIDISPSGVVWVHGWELHRYDGSAWTTFNADNSDISFTEGMGPLVFDHEENVWLGGTEPGIDIIHLVEVPPGVD